MYHYCIPLIMKRYRWGWILLWKFWYSFQINVKSNSWWKSEEYIRASCSCSWFQIIPFLSSGCNFVYSVISPSLHGSPLTVRGHISVWGSRALIISDIWTPQMAHPPKIAHKVNKSKTNKFPIDLAYGTLPKKEKQQTNLGEKRQDWKWLLAQ